MPKIAAAAGPLFLVAAFIAGKLYPQFSGQLHTAAIIAWMILWWITEVVPIPVTAMLPLVAYPLLGLSTIKATAANYGHPIIFLFMGGFLIAIALEKWQLHKRLALQILTRTGSSEKGILLGFMLSTSMLSMWISNTACTLMMLPIAASVLTYYDEHRQSESKLPVALMIALAASANIGGFMTLIGTPPNVVMTGLMKEMKYPTPDFAEWLLIGIPVGVILLFCVFFILSRIYYSLSFRKITAIDDEIRSSLNDMGKITSSEKKVIWLFVVTALLWIGKDLINNIMNKEWLDDTIIAMMGGLSLFLIPSAKGEQNLLNWDDVKQLPWGILLLFGGGLNIAMLLESSGLIEQIGDWLQFINLSSIISLVLLVTAFALFATELMSNVALATILIPVIATVAHALNIEPALLVIPVTIASSCAFMLPVSTPPNAIVFSSGRIKMNEMIQTGLWFNLLAAIIISLVCYVLIPIII